MSGDLDPLDWQGFEAQAARLLECAVVQLAGAKDGPVWQAFPESMKAEMRTDLPIKGAGYEAVAAQLAALLPYGVGNTHPRFFGWVHGSGGAASMLAEIAAAAMNANLGGRDHGAMYVEKQVVAWVRQMFGFPDGASGLVVSGTSMATIVALKAARDARINARAAGVGAHKLVGYASDQAHNCVARAFDMLGLGSDALRAVPVNAAFEMDITALRKMMAVDRAAGLEPFLLVGTAGSVNVGAFDDLAALADIAKAEGLWLHIDGAFGAAGVLSDVLRPRLKGIERADSIAFDFHKWLHVNYDAGFVLLRDEALHRAAFESAPDYLASSDRGLAAGRPWPVDYGPELSRGFRALKIWAQITALGTEALGAAISRNCTQAKLLAEMIDAEPSLERLAPVASSVVVFAHVDGDAVTEEIVLHLQESGLAVPSITTVNGRRAVRVNITNHRTRDADLRVLVDGCARSNPSVAFVCIHG
ncbi:MAG: cytochrome D ubiquinol oxidase subunit I [Rhodobacteraceae bacterium]|nr:cytochrome D ubiquinol oxidase subunit I [Paracoccaceae bacterium]